jgi:hypothetical protein
MLKRMWEMGHFTLLVGMENGSAFVENRIEAPQKIKDRNTYNPIVRLLTIYPKELK